VWRETTVADLFHGFSRVYTVKCHLCFSQTLCRFFKVALYLLDIIIAVVVFYKVRCASKSAVYTFLW